MKITKPLDNILNSQVKTKILRFLCRTGAEWNGRQIAKEIGVTPAGAHKVLNTLAKEGVFLMRNVGKTHIYSLNDDNFIVTDLLKPLFLKENEAFSKIISVIKRNISSSKIKSKIVSVALFGSVNIREERPTSDIDLAVIVADAETKPKTEKLFKDVDKKISKKFGNIISPYINTKAEFKAKHKRKLDVIKNILKSYTLIYGKRLERIL
ncbi:MAG: ArsR family transcriptional regulator [Candidatus Omnitrophica bacterium]|nr:ArsR family transcriptional regulator [Candidatus Omnitrophota bacterium]